MDVVGVVEDVTVFYANLEYRFPAFFGGLLREHERKGGVRSNVGPEKGGVFERVGEGERERERERESDGWPSPALLPFSPSNWTSLSPSLLRSLRYRYRFDIALWERARQLSRALERERVRERGR